MTNKDFADIDVKNIVAVIEHLVNECRLYNDTLGDYISGKRGVCDMAQYYGRLSGYISAVALLGLSPIIEHGVRYVDENNARDEDKTVLSKFYGGFKSVSKISINMFGTRCTFDICENV